MDIDNALIDLLGAEAVDTINDSFLDNFNEITNLDFDLDEFDIPEFDVDFGEIDDPEFDVDFGVIDGPEFDVDCVEIDNPEFGVDFGEIEADICDATGPDVNEHYELIDNTENSDDNLGFDTHGISSIAFGGASPETKLRSEEDSLRNEAEKDDTDFSHQLEEHGLSATHRKK